MAIPYREWTQIKIATLEGDGTSLHDDISDWTAVHYGAGKVGRARHLIANYHRWDVLAKPSGDDFVLASGMDEIMDCQFQFTLGLIDLNVTNAAVGVCFEMVFFDDPADPADIVDWALVNGKYFDGSNQWDSYPPLQTGNWVYWTDPQIPLHHGNLNQLKFSQIGTSMQAKFCSGILWAAIGPVSNTEQAWLFKNGISIRVNNFFDEAGNSLGWSQEIGDTCEYSVIPIKFNIRYWNPVVNSLSRYSAPTAGGVEVKLYGIGFDNDNDEIKAASRHGANSNPSGGDWNDYIQTIYFVGLQGQGTYRIDLPDFTIDANDEITIPAGNFPAMVAGTYNIRLETYVISDSVAQVRAWAGDWHCDADGRVHDGSRIVFIVRDEEQPRAGGVLLFDHYAPIDVRINEMMNEIVNGDFTSDTNGWTASGATLASVAGGVSGNCLRVTSNGYGYQELTGLTIGQPYHVAFYFKKGTASGGYIKVGTTQGGSEIQDWSGLTNAAWTIYEVNFIATTTTVYVSLGSEEAAKTALFDSAEFYQGCPFYDGRILGQTAITRALDDNVGLGSVSDWELELANADRYFSILLASDLLKNSAMSAFYAWTNDAVANKQAIFSGIVDDYVLQGDVFRLKIKDVTAQYFNVKVPQYFCSSDDFPNIDSGEIGKPMPEVLGICSLISTDAKGAVRAIYVDTAEYAYLAARGTLFSVAQVYADGVLVDPADYTVSVDGNGHTIITFDADQESAVITYNGCGYSVPDLDSASGFIQNPAYIRLYFLVYLMGIPISMIDVESFDDMADYFVTESADEAGYLIIQDVRDARDVLKEFCLSFGDVGYIAKDGRYTIGKKDVTDLAATTLFFNQIDMLDHPEWRMNLNTAVNYIKCRYSFFPNANYFQGLKEEQDDDSIDAIGATMAWELEIPWLEPCPYIDVRILEELDRRAYGEREVAFSVSIEYLDVLDLFTNVKVQDPFAVDESGGGVADYCCYVKSIAIDLQEKRIDLICCDLEWINRSGSGWA